MRVVDLLRGFGVLGLGLRIGVLNVACMVQGPGSRIQEWSKSEEFRNEY